MLDVVLEASPHMFCCRCRSDTKVAFIPGGFMDAVAYEFGKERFSAESVDSAITASWFHEGLLSVGATF